VSHNHVKFQALALGVWREMMTEHEHAHKGTVVGRQVITEPLHKFVQISNRITNTGQLWKMKIQYSNFLIKT
jgi:hypothetical protein